MKVGSAYPTRVAEGEKRRGCQGGLSDEQMEMSCTSLVGQHPLVGRTSLAPPLPRHMALLCLAVVMVPAHMAIVS